MGASTYDDTKEQKAAPEADTVPAAPEAPKTEPAAPAAEPPKEEK